MNRAPLQPTADDYVQQAHEAAERGEMDRVIPLLREAVKRSPLHVEANSHLGWVLTQWGRYREAIPAYFRLLLRRPWDWQVYFRATHTLWFAWRRAWGRLAERIPPMRCLSRIGRGAMSRLALLATPWIAPSSAAILPWMRNQLRVERLDEVNAYEYYKVAEIDFALRALEPLGCGLALDLGAGVSSLPSCLALSGCEVIAAERERQALHLQQRLGQRLGAPLRSTAGDFMALPFRDGSFDAVVFISSVEHVPGEGDSHAMIEAARVLKPGGKLIVTVPCGPLYTEQWTDHAIGHVYEEARVRGQEGGFLRIYDRAALHERLIDPTGLEVIESRVWGETSIWGWLGLGRNFVDHRGVIHPSVFAAPLCLFFAREIAWEELRQAHWSVALLRLRKRPPTEKGDA